MHWWKPLIVQQDKPLEHVFSPQSPLPSLLARQRPPLHANPWQQSHLLEHVASERPQQRSPLRSQAPGRASQTTLRPQHSPSREQRCRRAVQAALASSFPRRVSRPATPPAARERRAWRRVVWWRSRWTIRDNRSNDAPSVVGSSTCSCPVTTHLTWWSG